MTHSLSAFGPIARIALTLFAFAGCAQVLGIEDAHVDPALASQAAGAAGAQQTTAGVGGAPAQLLAGNAAGAAPSTSGTGGGALIGNAGVGGQLDPSEPEALCASYCDAVVSGCTGQHAQYIDLSACRAACRYFPAGAPGDSSGNTSNCRLTYAKKASSEPYTYCTWAGPGGDGKCGSNCQGFCTLMLQTCTQASTNHTAGDYFTSAADCQAACAGLKDLGSYSASDSSQQMGADDVQCRLYHVGAALAEDDPITHCPHAMGRTLCVDPSSN